MKEFFYNSSLFLLLLFLFTLIGACFNIFMEFTEWKYFGTIFVTEVIIFIVALVGTLLCGEKGYIPKRFR